jgi:GDP-L-fucose synthase
MEKNEKIYVAGHTGFIGSAIVQSLKGQGYHNLVTRTHAELNLIDQKKTEEFFKKERPAYVFNAAGRVGGKYANDTYRGEFLYENVMIGINVIHCSHMVAVKRFMFLGASAIYPQKSLTLFREDEILTGQLDPNEEPVAIANITGLKLCESYTRQYGDDFLAVIPACLYGPRQPCDPLNSLVIPSLIYKFHEAKIQGRDQVIVWGDGKAQRDFLYVNDFSDALIFLMQGYVGNDVLNIGTGNSLSIMEVATVIKEAVQYEGKVILDSSKPDSKWIKAPDLTKIRSLGWTPKIGFVEGIQRTYESYCTTLDTQMLVSL